MLPPGSGESWRWEFPLRNGLLELSVVLGCGSSSWVGGHFRGGGYGPVACRTGRAVLRKVVVLARSRGERLEYRVRGASVRFGAGGGWCQLRNCVTGGNGSREEHGDE